MKLTVYLKSKNLTSAEFARRIGRSRSCVLRWTKGQRRPDALAMAAIQRETAGQVTPNDFHDLPAASVEPAASEVAA